MGVGVVAGGLGAMLGVGGGIILVPGLVFFAGLPFQHAVAASLVCVVATSVSGSVVYLERHLVELPVAVELQFFTVVGAVVAGVVAAFLPTAPLYFAFALLLIATSVRMWPRGEAPSRRPRAFTGQRKRAAAGASVGAGIISGLLGVGGGVLNVPILHVLLGMAFDRAVATSVYIFGITAAAAAAVYLVRGDVALGVAGAAMIGTVVGAAGGAYLARKFDQRLLKAGFALILFYVAARMVLRGVAQL